MLLSDCVDLILSNCRNEGIARGRKDWARRKGVAGGDEAEKGI